MADDFAFDVFLSHSSGDKEIVRPLAERLRKDGLRVWFDEWELRPGDNIPSKIEAGLEQSRVLVLCMSAQAFGSDWSQLESGTFRFRDPLNKERRFIPLRLDDAPIKGSLAQFLYINWHSANREQEYAKLLEACRPLDRSRDLSRPDVTASTSAKHSDPLSLLQHEFETRLDNYVPLMHVKLDWLEGSSDPTRMKFKKVAEPGVSEDTLRKIDEDCSLFPGVPLNPEFWLTCWNDTKQKRFYPSRTCKHWVTIQEGSIDSAISAWNHFTSLAKKARDVVHRLGLRTAIDDPLQRWLIVLHDIVKPCRTAGGSIEKYSDENPLPDAVRLCDMQIVTDWVGCAIINDLHLSSSICCRILIDRVEGEDRSTSD